MATALDVSRKEIAFLVLYLGKAEVRDKICRAIQYGSKFVSNGEAGTAATVDKNTSLARKVFRLLKSVNELQALLAPAPESTPLPIVLLLKSKNVLVGTFLALDQIVWAGRTGIYQNKENTDLIGRISLYCWLAGNVCTSLAEVGEIGRLAVSMKKTQKDLRRAKQISVPDSQAKLKQDCAAQYEKSKERSLSLAKASLDIIVAIGLLQLAPKSVSPRVTGALGFVTSLMSCYQLLPAPPSKSKLI